MNLWNCKEWQQVTGEYFGVSYVGTVRKTESSDIMVHVYINLESPIVVFGDVRRSIVISGSAVKGSPFEGRTIKAL